MRLLWRAGYNGNSAIKYFRISGRFANKTEFTLPTTVMASGVIKKYKLDGLTPYTQYEFRIQAINDVGMSPWSGYSKEIRTQEARKSLTIQTWLMILILLKTNCSRLAICRRRQAKCLY